MKSLSTSYDKGIELFFQFILYPQNEPELFNSFDKRGIVS